MTENNTITLKIWNNVAGCVEDTGDTISVHTVAQSLSTSNFAALIEEFLRQNIKGWREGKAIGLNLRYGHRSLQRLAICFAFGMIVGLAEQSYFDDRNETAIRSAQKLSQMLVEGEFPFGPYI